MKHFARILFFINGAVPTQEDYTAAAKLAANVSFRNANAVPSEGALEACDGVAGHVPERYAKAYPEASEAIKLKDKAYRDSLKNSGDTLAPSVGTVGFGVNPDGTQTGEQTGEKPAPQAELNPDGSPKKPVWGSAPAPKA
jgi:hypothetical protein